MVKVIGCAMGLMLGFGSVIGYFIAKWDLQTNQITKSQEAIAQTAPDPKLKPKQVSLKPPDDPRTLLESKYALCTGARNPKELLAKFNEKELNDLVYTVCLEKS